jgi:hypothetical protein
MGNKYTHTKVKEELLNILKNSYNDDFNLLVDRND